MHIGKDLVAAAATPLVLGILAEGESYGYAILQRVEQLSDGELSWSDGMLYPLLHRLERLGYVESAWHAAPIRPAPQALPAERRRACCARRAAPAVGRGQQGAREGVDAAIRRDATTRRRPGGGMTHGGAGLGARGADRLVDGSTCADGARWRAPTSTSSRVICAIRSTTSCGPA